MYAEEGTISISDDYSNRVRLFYTNDDTQYSGLVSSFDDLYQYQSLYLSVVLQPTEENQDYVNDIFLTFDWIMDYYTNAEGKNIITNIDVTRIEETIE